MKRGWTAGIQKANGGRLFQPIHGMRNTLTGSSWIAMVSRCCDPTNDNYKNYGGRGVRVCAFLKATPRNLILLIGERPSPEYSIDRIDNDGSYTCGECEECVANSWTKNVRWGTRHQQNNNKRTSAVETIDGESKTASQWADQTGIARHLVFGRRRIGITGAALIAPVKEKRRFVTINGVTKPQAEWAAQLGIGVNAFALRLKRGWTGSQLLQKRLRSNPGPRAFVWKRPFR